MELDQARTLALKLMEEFGLLDTSDACPFPWGFAFNNRKRHLGVCRHKSRTIYLSRPYVLNNPIELIEDTIRHEIAHAKVGKQHDHNRVWQAMAIQCGAKPNACKFAFIPSKYIATCPGCGAESRMHRRPRVRYKCSICWRMRREEHQFDYQEANRVTNHIPVSGDNRGPVRNDTGQASPSPTCISTLPRV